MSHEHTPAGPHVPPPDERTVDERRAQWNERHAAGDFEGHGANPGLERAVRDLKPGRALELACGSGTNAVWLATKGWRVTAVDWSPVALGNGRAKAKAAGVAIDWLERDLFEWTPPARSFDLVAIVYLHLPGEERAPVYRAAVEAVAAGGHLVIVGHDRLNATEGVGGPPAERLFTAEEIGRELTGADPRLEIVRAEVFRQVAPPERGPIDALLVLRRRAD